MDDELINCTLIIPHSTFVLFYFITLNTKCPPGFFFYISVFRNFSYLVFFSSLFVSSWLQKGQFIKIYHRKKILNTTNGSDGLCYPGKDYQEKQCEMK